MRVNTLKIIADAIDNATSRYKGQFVPDTEKSEDFCFIAKRISEVCESLNTRSFLISVDDSTKDILVKLVCTEFIVDCPTHSLYRLMPRCKEVEVSKCEDVENAVELDFTLSGIWVPAESGGSDEQV